MLSNLVVIEETVQNVVSEVEVDKNFSGKLKGMNSSPFSSQSSPIHDNPNDHHKGAVAYLAKMLPGADVYLAVP